MEHNESSREKLSWMDSMFREDGHEGTFFDGTNFTKNVKLSCQPLIITVKEKLEGNAAEFPDESSC